MPSKILFICSSAEPGKSGVGDYTLRLAGALVKLQYGVSIISINDPYITDITSGEQIIEDSIIPIVRLPDSWSWKRRIDSLVAAVENARPEWISLQYVLYAFHPKGLPFSLSKYLNRIQGYKWHIMFHELWFGMENNRSLKEGVYARLQSHIIFKMLADLKPVVIHTQTPLYKAQLAKRNYTASILPLFGNIPVSVNRLPGKKNQVAVFGSIYPESLIEEFTAKYLQFKSKGILPLKLLFIGRNGVEKEKWTRLCQEASIDTETLGELSAETVSEVLYTCIAGVSTTPALLIDKSGTAAALREHNLPIIDLARPWKAKGIDIITTPKDLLTIHRFFDLYSVNSLPVTNYSLGLEYTAQLFVQDLHLDTL